MKIERPSGQGAQAPVVTASRALSSQREPAPTPRVASRRAVEGADEAREAHGRITLLERARREADSLATLYQDLRDVVDDALNQSEPGTSKQHNQDSLTFLTDRMEAIASDLATSSAIALKSSVRGSDGYREDGNPPDLRPSSQGLDPQRVNLLVPRSASAALVRIDDALDSLSRFQDRLGSAWQRTVDAWEPAGSALGGSAEAFALARSVSQDLFHRPAQAWSAQAALMGPRAAELIR